jgi:hypothetical protein
VNDCNFYAGVLLLNMQYAHLDRNIYDEKYDKAPPVMSFIEKMRALFRASKGSSAAELLNHVSQQMQELAKNMQKLVEAAASGKHGVADATIEYVLHDRTGGELQTEWQDTDYITYDDIVQTSGFQSLQQQARTLSVKLKLIEESIEEVDDEERVRFVVRLSGWGS